MFTWFVFGFFLSLVLINSQICTSWRCDSSSFQPNSSLLRKETKCYWMWVVHLFDWYSLFFHGYSITPLTERPYVLFLIHWLEFIKPFQNYLHFLKITNSHCDVIDHYIYVPSQASNCKNFIMSSWCWGTGCLQWPCKSWPFHCTNDPLCCVMCKHNHKHNY